MTPEKTKTPMNLETLLAMSPHDAMQRLMDGNKRFLAQLEAPPAPPTDRKLSDFVKETSSKGQFPFALVLSCVDSRMPTELLFDQSIGDIFNARIAGNFINEDILGSMEFACTRATTDKEGKTVPIPVRVILVLGHTSCGAVGGATQFVYPECFPSGDDNDKPGPALENLVPMLEKIAPAVKMTPFNLKAGQKCKEEGWRTDFINRAARKNVALTINNILAQSKDIRDLSNTGNLLIVGAMYNIYTGEVDFSYNPVNPLS